MDKDNIIELTGDNGDVVKAEYLDTVLVDEVEYVVMLPLDQEGCGEEGCEGCSCGGDGEEVEVIIMRIGEENGEEVLMPIEDDAELERAFEAFQEQSEYCDTDDED